MQNIRSIVYNSLLKCIDKKRFSNLEADSTIQRYALVDRDRRFYTTMFYGTIERQITIDHQIKKLSSTPIEKLDTKVLVLVRMGLYQILFMDSIPDHAAINETVELAKQNVNKGAVGYINGLLRSAQRNLKDETGTLRLFVPDRVRDICGHLSITYSFPRYLCKLWVNAYGTEVAEKIMHSQNSRTSLTLQVNSLKISHKEYLDILKDASIDAIPSEICADGVHVMQNIPITSLPGYNDGLFFIQDDSSNRCVELLDVLPDLNVLDACACPGGKSFACAIKMENKGKIVSCDLHESKLSLITSGAKRLGIDIINAIQADSSIQKKEFICAFDRVLCDVPCSGFGTISKKPDLRLRPQDSLSELADIQLKIVNNCASYLKSGGTLVYSTCTLNPDENENNIKRFLDENPNFTLVEMRNHFPFDAICDGFFTAKMIKK